MVRSWPYLPSWLLLITLLWSGGSALAAGNGDVASGRRDFMELCAGCHGENGKGAGPKASQSARPPADLTRISARSGGVFDEKAVFDWRIGLDMATSHGTRDMPIWGDRLMDESLKDQTSLDAARDAEKEVERRVMAIVSYLETLQAGD